MKSAGHPPPRDRRWCKTPRSNSCAPPHRAPPSPAAPPAQPVCICTCHTYIYMHDNGFLQIYTIRVERIENNSHSRKNIPTPHKGPTCQPGPPELGRRNRVVTKKLDARNCFCRYRLFFSPKPSLPTRLYPLRQSRMQDNLLSFRSKAITLLQGNQSCFLVVLLFPFQSRSRSCHVFIRVVPLCIHLGDLLSFRSKAITLLQGNQSCFLVVLLFPFQSREHSCHIFIHVVPLCIHPDVVFRRYGVVAPRLEVYAPLAAAARS
jgi:hypothetical protein